MKINRFTTSHGGFHTTIQQAHNSQNESGPQKQISYSMITI